MTNPLQSLKINAWYKVFTVVSAACLLASLTVDLKGIDNKTGILMSLGVLVLSVGEWINHPLQARLIPGGIITSYNRQACLLGSLFDVLGFLLLYLGVSPLQC